MSLRAAFEDILADENLINPVSDMTETEVAEILEEVQEKSDEVVKTEEMVEILEEESTALEGLISALESSEDGITEREAVMYHHALESIGRRLYMTDISRSQPATESFGSDRDALAATLEAAADSKNMLQRLWETIRNAVAKMWNSIKDFFASFGKSIKALTAASTQLRAKAKARHEAGFTAAGEFDAAKHARALTLDGTTFKHGDMAGIQKAVVLAMNEEYKARKYIVEGTIKAANLKEGESVEGFKEAQEEKVAKTLAKLTLPGNYQMTASLGRFTYKQGKNEFAETKLTGAAPVKVGSDICDVAETMINKLSEHLANVKKVDTEVKAAIEKAKAATGVEGTLGKARLKLTEYNARWSASGITQVPSRVASTIKAVLSYGNACVNAAVKPGEAK